jgi:hypothetical protein
MAIVPVPAPLCRNVCSPSGSQITGATRNVNRPSTVDLTAIFPRYQFYCNEMPERLSTANPIFSGPFPQFPSQLGVWSLDSQRFVSAGCLYRVYGRPNGKVSNPPRAASRPHADSRASNEGAVWRPRKLHSSVFGGGTRYRVHFTMAARLQVWAWIPAVTMRE